MKEDKAPGCFIPHPSGESGRQESNLPVTAYQTVASPFGIGPKERPVRESNPSHLLDRQAGTPASSQGKQSAWRESNPPARHGEPVAGPLGHRRIHNSKGGRSRTLCACFGGRLLSQEHTPDNHRTSGPGGGRTHNLPGKSRILCLLSSKAIVQ